ncbi:MAG: DUF1614 domain-containing protein [Methanoregulaceae archaeon]|nr:MAG: DUF1614 domain-containing protein [Methanoregulaceae archaeon]
MAGDIRFFSAGPLSVLAVVLLIGLVLFLIPLLFVGIIGAAFTRLGLSWITALALVLLMLAGSFVNIPFYRIRRDMVRVTPLGPDGDELGVPFAVPPVWETVLSVNLGGGIIPTGIAAYLVFKAVMVTGTSVLPVVSLCTALVLVISYVTTHEIAGTGIRVPIFIPALTALLAGTLLAGGTGLTAAVTALAGGTLGTIAGGNLARLCHVRDLEVPEISIGGSGTFGAVFLCCVLPALIA